MSAVEGSRTLARLRRICEGFKITGKVTGEVVGGRVNYYLGTQHLGDSAPSARKMLRKMAGVEDKKEAKKA